jgi:transcriptional regulator of acetoin/glycerol metabolism
VETYPANEIEIHPHRDFCQPRAVEGRFQRFEAEPEMDRLRIVGETPAMQELRKNIERVAPLDCTVTLRGEPGTGKGTGGQGHPRREYAPNRSVSGRQLRQFRQ